MKQRNIAVSIILTIVTCGIYGFVWMAMLNDELSAVSGRQNATSGGMVVLFSIITCGIYGIYWAYKMGETVEAIHAQRGVPSSSAPILYLVLTLLGVGIVAYALMQNELNQCLPNA